MIENRSLRQILETKKVIAWPLALKIALQAGQELAVAHNQNILHLHLTPEHIMLANSGEIKVLDCGLAQTRGHGSLPKDTDKPPSVAPEWWQQGQTSQAADVFSLAAILYEMTSGKPPDGHTTLGELCPSLADEVAPVIMQALDPDPGQRPQSVQSLLEQLLVTDEYQSSVPLPDSKPDDLPVPPANDTQEPPAKPGGRINWRSIWVGAMVGVMSGAVLGLTLGSITGPGGFFLSGVVVVGILSGGGAGAFGGLVGGVCGGNLPVESNARRWDAGCIVGVLLGGIFGHLIGSVAGIVGGALIGAGVEEVLRRSKEAVLLSGLLAGCVVGPLASTLGAIIGNLGRPIGRQIRKISQRRVATMGKNSGHRLAFALIPDSATLNAWAKKYWLAAMPVIVIVAFFIGNGGSGGGVGGAALGLLFGTALRGPGYGIISATIACIIGIPLGDYLDHYRFDDESSAALAAVMGGFLGGIASLLLMAIHRAITSNRSNS